ncbi:glycosyltransferase family 4 protein [Lichenicoccus sp.]|uniref:glycosyltransferase family 4 protein n=1 Tax=Lichenicoccus sp. TaxID=2781899 RepID=UPI003D0F0884
MRILVWQWGRRGAGPRVAAELAAGLRTVPGQTVFLSLSTRAEILTMLDGPTCALPVVTYDGLVGFLFRALLSPLTIWPLLRRLRALAPDVAICAMPGPLDLMMVWALRRLGVKIVVTVHDADLHPGDGFPLQMALQRRLIRRADALVALTGHVAVRLRQQPAARNKPLLTASLPPLVFGAPPPPPLAHGGPMRLLCFGRLLPYKGLDLLEAALRGMDGTLPDFEMRIAGEGPPSATLRALASLPHVRVENRWVPENAVGPLIAWADAVVLPYREASQSGVAAVAIAAGRWVVATRVGGLTEQFRDERLAFLCEPDPASIRAALARLLVAPPKTSGQANDPRLAWRDVADQLTRQISAALFKDWGSAPNPAKGLPLLGGRPHGIAMRAKVWLLKVKQGSRPHGF